MVLPMTIYKHLSKWEVIKEKNRTDIDTAEIMKAGIDADPILLLPIQIAGEKDITAILTMTGTETMIIVAAEMNAITAGALALAQQKKEMKKNGSKRKKNRK